MNHQPKTRHNLRRYAGIVGAFAFVLGATLVPTGPALAASGPFDIDGDVPDSVAAAFEFPDEFGNVKELGPKNSSSTKIGVIHNAAPPMLAKTNPNAQVDLRRAWITTGKDTGTGHDWLYFAWERDSNSGSGFISYEFMKAAAPTACAYNSATDAQLTASCNPWKNRQAGDFMILWDQSGSSVDLWVRTWSGTPGNLTLGPGVLLDDDVSEALFSDDGFRGEAAVDLTAAVFGPNQACVSFANTIPSTVTGNSDTADYKDTILRQTTPISNCVATIATTPKKGDGTAIPGGGLPIGTGAVPVKDSALVGVTGGAATPAGSVTFWLCKVDFPATCSSGGTEIGSTNLSGANYPATVLSPLAYVTATGRYCWRATFSGDAANGVGAVTDSSANECFTVNAATPSLTTTAGAGGYVGDEVTDSASLSGTVPQPADPVINTTGATGAVAGGTVAFKLYGPSDSGCGSLAYTSDPVDVSGDDTYDTPDPQFTPSAAGTYHWVAIYSGSPNTNAYTHNEDCDVTDEDVTIDTAPSTLSSVQTWVPNDTVTVSSDAGGELAGKVYFDLFPTEDCTGEARYSASFAVSGSSPQEVSTSNTTQESATGTYSWQVRYDSTNAAQQSIPNSCEETSSLSVDNGDPVSSE